VKLLIAYDASARTRRTVDNLLRAGLPQEAEVLLLSIAQTDQPVAVTGDLIRSSFPKWRFSFEAISGPPTDAILKTIGWWRPDLLIIGSDEFSNDAVSYGSRVWLEVLHQAKCSVRINKPRANGNTKPIRLLIGIDGSENAAAITKAVAGRCWPRDTEAQVVSVAENGAEKERERLRAANESAVKSLYQAGLVATGSITEGDPHRELLVAADQFNADTIFIGARGTERMRRFLVGSVATAVVTRSRCIAELVR